MSFSVGLTASLCPRFLSSVMRPVAHTPATDFMFCEVHWHLREDMLHHSKKTFKWGFLPPDCGDLTYTLFQSKEK